jgi:hypothetical protein
MWWWQRWGYGYGGPSYQTAAAVLRSRYTYLGLLGLGLILGAAFAYEDAYLRAVPTTFRKTTGVVEDVAVVVHAHGRWGAPLSFAPEVTFRYAAPDGEHVASGYRLQEGGMPEWDAERIADRYEEGQAVDCWYDPSDPNTAVLTLESDTRGLGWLAAWAVVLSLGGLAGWVVVDFVCPPAPAATPAAAELPLLVTPAPGPPAPPDALQAEPPRYTPRWGRR